MALLTSVPLLPLSERSVEEKLASLPAHERKAWFLAQDPKIRRDIVNGAWWYRRRAKQEQPPGNWLVWVIGAGRGWGKTQVGSETLLTWVIKYPRDRGGNRTEWMVVAETLADVVKYNIEGPSGLQNAIRRAGYRKLNRPPRDDDKTTRGYTYVKAPKPVIVLYPDRQIIHFDSADNDDVGRGANLAGLWLDEVAKWGPMAHDAWYNGLLPALRVDLPGDGKPRCLVTTTPKPIGLLKEWYTRARAGDAKYRLTLGSTYENVGNLNPDTLQEFLREYEGTRLGRQELYGELLDEVEGALWTRKVIDDHRVFELPKLARVVIGVDPTGTGQGDEMGLVAVGATVDGHQYVLSDLSRNLAGMAGARLAWKTLIEHQRHMPDRYTTPFLVVEEDYAKDWLKDSLDAVYKSMQTEKLFPRHDRAPIRYVSAALLGGKGLRAEPVAMRYELGRIHHFGVHPGLEDQMCTWDPRDKKAHSPDRVDALVHASLWLRDQEGKTTEVGTWGDDASLPVTRLNV